MGQVLSQAEQTILHRLFSSNNANSSAQNETNQFNQNMFSFSNSNETQTNVANSRNNFINQLIALSNSNRRRKPKSTNQNANLHDFQNVAFGSHFYLAGHKFKNLISQAQTFLFGDQLDLAFILSHKPVHFPYETSPINAPSNCLQSLVNIRKDTLRLVKCFENNFCESAPVLYSNNDNVNNPHNMNNTNSSQVRYNIEFVFDSDVDVQIRIHYFATEKTVEPKSSSNSKLPYLSYACNCSRFNMSYLSSMTINNNDMNVNANSDHMRCICLNDEQNPIIYKKGANILFKQPKHVIVPSRFPIAAWQFNIHSNYYPIVIECTPIDAALRHTHAHITLAYIEKSQTILTSPTNPELNNTNTNNNNNATLTTSQANQAQTANLCSFDKSKALSMGCISQINHVYQIKSIKQKQFINGLVFSLQEIYGIEKKYSDELSSLSAASSAVDEETMSQVKNVADGDYNDEEAENGNSSDNQLFARTSTSFNPSKRWTSVDTQVNPSNDTITSTTSSNLEASNNNNDQAHANDNQDLKGIECVICMCESRDTLILPCRHLCLCKLCAINLRLQSNNCPICRIPFIALIQIKLFKKKNASPNSNSINSVNQLAGVNLDHINEIEEASTANTENIPPSSTSNNNSNGTSDKNLIVKIKQLKKGGNEQKQQQQQQRKKDDNMLILSENALRKLSESFECVTIYDAFNYHELKPNSNNNNNKIYYNKSPRVHKQSKETARSGHIQAKNRSEINKKSMTKRIANAAQKTNIRSCSVILGSSGDFKLTRKDSIRERSLTNAQHSKSKSANDVRKADEISLEKISINSNSKASNIRTAISAGASGSSHTRHKVSCSKF